MVSWRCHSPCLVTGVLPPPGQHAGRREGRAGIQEIPNSPRPCRHSPRHRTTTHHGRHGNSPRSGRPPEKLTTALGRTHHACSPPRRLRPIPLTNPQGAAKRSSPAAVPLRRSGLAVPCATPCACSSAGDCAARLRSRDTGTAQNPRRLPAPALRSAQSWREYCAGGCTSRSRCCRWGRRRRCAALPEPLRNGLSASLRRRPAPVRWGRSLGAHPLVAAYPLSHGVLASTGA